MTVSLWSAFLVWLTARLSIVAGVNSILGTYCKGAVHKKGNKILAESASWIARKKLGYKKSVCASREHVLRTLVAILEIREEKMKKSRTETDTNAQIQIYGFLLLLLLLLFLLLLLPFI